MKYYLMLIMVLAVTSSQAQTWEEWTQQKKTQKKYLLQQIAAFQTYLGYARKGYQIAQEGLHTIGQIKDGEWTLHKDFFSSLKAVNPAVVEAARLAYFIRQQANIVKQSRQLISACRQQGFTASEVTYVQRVLDRLLEDGLTQLDQLYALTTNGDLQMSDDERLQQIYARQGTWQDVCTGFRSFKISVYGLAKNRQKEASEIQFSKQLNGIQ